MKILISLFTLLPFLTFAAPAPARLRYDPVFILKKVLEKKNLSRRVEIPFPELHVESKTPLIYFQNVMETQWGFRPEYFSNAFAIHSNKIFLIDDFAYYQRLKRCIDDSLAHELVHYVQAKYQGWDMSDESLEWEAIDIQTSFREEFCKT